MAKFVFTPVVPYANDTLRSAALGVNAAGRLTDKDVGKAVKLAANNNYVLAADGNDIEGMLFSVEPATVNDGFGMGTVQTKEFIVASNAGAGAIAVGALVIAAAQPAVGTEISVLTTGENITGVRPMPVKAGTPVLFNWRVISLLGGNGGVGTSILIERI